MISEPGLESRKPGWLRELPDGWQAVRLKYLAQCQIGLTYDPADVVGESEGGTLVLRSGNIQEGKISLLNCVYVSSHVPGSLLTRPGDILVCSRNGSARLTWIFRAVSNDGLMWLRCAAG